LKRLTGKLIVGQSGGCTHVINSSLRGVVETARSRKGVTATWGMRYGIEGALKGDVISLDAEDPQTVRAVGRVPAAALGSCRRRITAGEAERVIRFFALNDVRFFIYIGGNDSADTAHRVSLAARKLQYPVRVIAVPKTIDNDLPLTHHCPGYGSAARFIASVVADTGIETEAMRTVEPVKIIEVMGRNAGWLPCAAALAKRSARDAPQFIWPPEIPFNRDKFLRLVDSSLKRLGYCVVVISETLKDARGRPVAARDAKLELDAFGHPRTAGAAAHLCHLVRSRLGVRARWDKPGTIQRMASAYLSEPDLRDARACGQWAVRFALRGRSDCMVVIRKESPAARSTFDTVPIEEIANREKTFPPSWFDQSRMLPTRPFLRYALPLVGESLPAHTRLRAKRANFATP